MAIIIAILISLGMVSSTAEFNSLDQQEQSELIDIVIVDDLNM